jgi:hypothetical protein
MGILVGTPVGCGQGPVGRTAAILRLTTYITFYYMTNHILRTLAEALKPPVAVRPCGDL